MRQPLNARMRLLERKLGPAWQSTHESTAQYFELVKKYIAGKNVVDIGCGTAITYARSDRRVFATYTGVDVLHYGSWKTPTNDPIFRFHVSEFAFVGPLLRYSPDVILIQDVVGWLSYVEIRRLLFSLPDKTRIIVSDSNLNGVSNAFPGRRLNLHQLLQLPLSDTSSFVSERDAHTSIVKTLYVIDDLSSWRTRQVVTRLPEPCPSCEKEIPNIFFLQNDVSKPSGGKIYCDECAFSVDVPQNSLSSEETRVAWNKSVQFSYTLA